MGLLVSEFMRIGTIKRKIISGERLQVRLPM